MPKYKAKKKTWLGHENRMVEEGEVFETEFPKVGGKEMRLSDNLELISSPKSAAKKKKESDSNMPPEGDNTGDDDGSDNAGDNTGDNSGNAGDGTGDQEGDQ
jgi:hypothetical protein